MKVFLSSVGIYPPSGALDVFWHPPGLSVVLSRGNRHDCGFPVVLTLFGAVLIRFGVKATFEESALQQSAEGTLGGVWIICRRMHLDLYALTAWVRRKHVRGGRM